MSNDQNFVPQSAESVFKEGNGLEMTGFIIAGFGLIFGFVLIFMSGTPALFALVPVGLFVMMAGYLKKAANGVAAQYALQKHTHDEQRAISSAAQTEHQA